jgi:hypothetical protein
VGPPDTIIPPGCPTVIIGSGGGGGGGAGSGGGGAGGASSAGVEIEAGHYLDVKFVDKGGKPICGVEYLIKTPSNEIWRGALTGRIRRNGIAAGNYEITLKAITKAEWDPPQLSAGGKVKLKVETSGIDSGARSKLEIWERNAGKADKLIHTIDDRRVSGDKIEAEWERRYRDPEDEDDGEQAQRPNSYSSPQYYFTVEVDGILGRSPLLTYRDFIEIELKDVEGNPIADEEYILTLPDGSIRQGRVDRNGYAKEERIAPGKCLIRFPNIQDPADVR